MTSALRGCPLARRTTCPAASSTSTVGVRRTSRRRTRSRCDSASMSTKATPATVPDTSDRMRRVARHGEQKGLEKWTGGGRAAGGGREKGGEDRRGGAPPPGGPADLASREHRSRSAVLGGARLRGRGDGQ